MSRGFVDFLIRTAACSFTLLACFLGLGAGYAVAEKQPCAAALVLPMLALLVEQAPRYGEIRMPVTIISGDIDKTVSTNIHSRPFAATVAGTKLIVLPGMGHMIQNAVPDLVAEEIETMMGRIGRRTSVAVESAHRSK